MTVCVLSKLAKVETVYFRFRSTVVTSSSSFFIYFFYGWWRGLEKTDVETKG